MSRLTLSQLKAWRERTIEEQGGVCALCGTPFTANNPPAADHDHAAGTLRGVLHRGCNAALGVIENGRARYILKDTARLSKFLAAVVPYIYKRRPDAPTYPTHRTADEKRLLRNKRARLATAKRRAAGPV